MVNTRSCCLGKTKRRDCHGASFPLGLTLEPPDELLEPTAMWTELYEWLLTEGQTAAWFRDGSSRVKGQHLVWKATTLIEEGKTKSAQCAELYGAFLAAVRIE